MIYVEIYDLWQRGCSYFTQKSQKFFSCSEKLGSSFIVSIEPLAALFLWFLCEIMFRALDHFLRDFAKIRIFLLSLASQTLILR